MLFIGLPPDDVLSVRFYKNVQRTECVIDLD